MQYFRNREIKQMTIIMMFLTVILSAVGFNISEGTGIIVLITVFLMCSIFFIFTKRRYTDLKKLSEYLRRIVSGEYSLDIRDNMEGEFPKLVPGINNISWTGTVTEIEIIPRWREK